MSAMFQFIECARRAITDASSAARAHQGAYPQQVALPCVQTAGNGTPGKVLWISTHCTGYTDNGLVQRDSGRCTLDWNALYRIYGCSSWSAGL
jgi:hypothetical protein